MKYTSIKNTEHPLFAPAWHLYRRSFPPEERRGLRTQRKIMNHPLYHFEIITDKGEFTGFVLWWGFDDVRYLEHLATTPRRRGKGYGRRILEKFVSASELPVLLEVELPVTETGRRRIDFYRRAGFVLNGHAYRQPPYKKGGDGVPLMLMTYPDAITGEEAARFCRLYHPVIFLHGKEKC
jgi:ribosomal protein S18 acetylase RimI-like enzyme